jgi:transcriptional regulator with XRE-family HTH domain
MDDVRIGAPFRAVRLRRGLRQADVALKAKVTRITVSRIERGMLGRYPVDVIRRIASGLEMRLDIGVRWHGGDLERALNSGHAAMHESVGRYLNTRSGWIWAPEVTFAIFGERGVIDVLAWHAASRSLLIIELKTLLVDPQDLLTTTDRRRRLARRIASEGGWTPATVSAWVIVADTQTNRRRMQANRTLLRSALPADGHAMRSWLKNPAGAIFAISFWTDDLAGITGQRSGRLVPRSTIGRGPSPHRSSVDSRRGSPSSR